MFIDKLYILLYNKNIKNKGNQQMKTYTAEFTDKTIKETKSTSKYLAQEYFKVIVELTGKTISRIY